MTPLRQKMIRDLKLRGRADSTINSYTRIVSDLAQYYHCPPDLLTTDHVQDYLFYLVVERNYAEASLNQAAHALKFFYHTTLKWPKLEFVIPTAKKPKKLPSIFSRAEIEILFENTSNLRDLALLMVAYGNGLRISEVVNLKVSDLDGSRMAIHIRDGKGGKDRMGGFSKRLHKSLQEYWLAYHPKVWLFPSPKYPQKHLTVNSARKMFHQVNKKAGIQKPVCFHSLRHSFATHLLEGGKNVREIQKLMGHKSIMSTYIYVHLAQGSNLEVDSPLDLPPEPKR